MGADAMIGAHEAAGYEEMVYADPQTARAVQEQREGFRRGRPVDKTAAMTPRAIHFILRRPKEPVPTSLYFYDVAGEAYDSTAAAGALTYFDHVDGIVFVIDPLTIEPYHQKMALEAAQLGLRVSSTDPEDAFRRMLGSLQRASRTGNAGLLKARLSVVVARTDIFEIRKEIDGHRERLSTVLATKKPPEPGALESAAVRAWLQAYGMENLLRAFEADFAQVRYFAVSALGRIPAPGDHRPFQGHGVLAPVVWVAWARPPLENPMKPPRVGIDLGTTNSVVAILDEHGLPRVLQGDSGATVPSAVNLGGEPEVGKAARDAAAFEPDNVAQFFKRNMGLPSFRFEVGGRGYSAQELSEIVLRSLRERAEEQVGPLGETVISVPAYFMEPSGPPRWPPGARPA